MSAIVAVRQILGDGLGASQVAAALGVSRWKAPITLWLELTGQAPPTPAGEPAYWGTKLEPVIRGEYIERHGVEVRIPKQSEYHPSVSWARATVDGYVFAPAAPSGDLARSHVLECKTVGLRLADDWGDGDSPEVPDYYVTQAIWQMFVTGLRRVDFAVLLGGQHYFECQVHHDPDLEESVVEAASEFWDLVQRRQAPQADATEAHAKYLRSRIKYNESIVPAPADVDDLAVRWRDLVREYKRLEKEESLIYNRILERGLELDAAKFQTSVGRIGVSKPGTKNARDYEALARDLAARLQLRGESLDFDAELTKRTTTTPTDGSLRRPNNWAKGS